GHRHRLVAAQGEHRLDRETEARLKIAPDLAAAVVRDLGILVHRPANAMADELADHAVAFRPGDVLDGRPDVADVVARLGCRDSGHHGHASRLDQLADRLGWLADEEGPGRVAVPAVDDRAGIDRDELALADRPLAGDAMDDLGIDRDADAARKWPARVGPRIALERGQRAASADMGLGQGIEMGGTDPRTELRLNQGEDFGHDPAGPPHRIDL